MSPSFTFCFGQKLLHPWLWYWMTYWLWWTFECCATKMVWRSRSTSDDWRERRDRHWLIHSAVLRPLTSLPRVLAMKRLREALQLLAKLQRRTYRADRATKEWPVIAVTPRTTPRRPSLTIDRAQLIASHSLTLAVMISFALRHPALHSNAGRVDFVNIHPHGWS